MEETICAIATPPGEGGVGIIRISGENSYDILMKIFSSLSSDCAASLQGRKLAYGHIIDNFSGDIIDEAMCVYMKAPHSYTGEDVAEVQCHGSRVSLKNILDLIIRNGARMAQPGEFTKRAFLNGRLDLSQAEAVIDLIRAKSDGSFNSALEQLEGRYSQKIKSIRGKIIDVLVNIAVNIDYPDEDIEELNYVALEKDLREIKEDISAILATADTGKILKDGLNTAIIGKPNVGKSSLMNALLRENRAIVTEIPGTTRDTIEEYISIQGIPVKLIDTAGIRETTDTIEKIGIEKSRQSFEEADLVLYVVDSSEALSEEDLQTIEELDRDKTIIVLNKSDLDKAVSEKDIEQLLPGVRIIETSLKEADSTIFTENLATLEKTIANMVFEGKAVQKDSIVLTNARHKGLFLEAEKSIADGAYMAKAREPFEVLEIDVNNAYIKLGEIIGEETADDVIDQVFARFCLGK